MFAITAETRVQNAVQFDIALMYSEYKAGRRKNPFPFVLIESIESHKGVGKDYRLLDGVTLAPDAKPTIEQVTPESVRNTLAITFVSPKDSNTKHTETFWDVLPSDAKYAKKSADTSQRIAHFWVNISGLPTSYLFADALEKALGRKIKEGSAEDFFAAVAKQFNTAGVNGTPVWVDGEDEKIYQIKLVRAGEKAKRPNDLQMPLYGNMIEQYLGDDAPSQLSVLGSDLYALIDVTATPKVAIGQQGGVTIPSAKKSWGDLPNI